MGVCCTHFKKKKRREPVPSNETFKQNLPSHSQTIINDTRNASDMFQIATAANCIKDKNILYDDREQFHSITTKCISTHKKPIKSEIQLNERILKWISEIDQNYSLSPPASMLSLNTLLIREHQSPRRQTNKQEIIDQKRQNK